MAGMSDPYDDVREHIRQAEDLIRGYRAEGIPEIELAVFKENLALMRRSLAACMLLSREPTQEEIEMNAFADRLAARQGTFMPDFDALAKKKAELDQRLLGP